MKQFACSELVPDCDHQFEADSEEEILQHILGHARDVHGMPEVPPEVIDQVRSMLAER